MAPPSSSSSLSSDDQSKKEPARSLDTTNQPHNPTTTATTTTISSAGGASNPPIGYGTPNTPIGYPPPYQPYPPNRHYAYNPYTQPPPPHYYYANQNYTYSTATAGGGGAGSGSAFVRGFLAMIITLITITCVVSIITWLVLRPEIPVFHVDKFAVSGLNISGPEFSAKWDASVTVENPNHKLKIYLEQVQGFVYYKENFLSSSPVDPMLLETRSRNSIAMKLATNNTEQHLVGRWVEEDIAKERSGGAVSFNLRMLVLATFKSGAWWTRHASMKVFCEDLKVNFVGGEISGVLDIGGGKPEDCVVYYA
ncbi:hypothetical protein L484_002234 [Morus notabilis]|uniref:Late embryogenesis abundant protein LEA-2 subgroup domain-containing protein n=1 Tax=Morus notabilis TaxID=981085 RepID=W9S1S2_9ROSA|nr:NDR1/HIN1-like protein 13 [Morus notabilis]EXC21224.1 hypothetical protein L484_002234 [Morus notabilis]